MKFHVCREALLFAAALPLVWSAPTRPRNEERQAPPDTSGGAVVEAPTATPVPPPGTKGVLRGSPDLAGYNAGNPIDMQDTEARHIRLKM